MDSPPGQHFHDQRKILPRSACGASKSRHRHGRGAVARLEAPSRPWQGAALLLIALLALPAGGVLAQPVLQTDTTLATAGYFRLTWPGASGEFELQQAGTDDFQDARLIYQGPDTASVVSGLPDGDYFYRVRQRGETRWSETLHIEVRHHPLNRAFGFFLLGAVMFAATLGILLHGVTRRGTT